MIGQREKVYAILRSENRWIDVYEILQITNKTRDSKVNHIAPPAIRRCLQELLDMGKVKKKKQYWVSNALFANIPLWYATPMCVCK